MLARADGAELFYTTRGNGPACLVPSGIGTGPYERQTPPQLSDRLKLVYVDLRGSGRSTGEPTDLNFDVLADDLETIRLDLRVERIAVLGHSILGMLAIEYARRCPASVSHVITVCTPPSGDLAGYRRRPRLSSRRTRRRIESRPCVTTWPGCRQTHRGCRPSSLTRQCAFATLASTPPRCLRRRCPGRRFSCTSWGRWPAAGTSAPAPTATRATLRRSRALRLRRPALPMGRHHGQAPNATLQLFEQSGHQPFFEEPDRFAAAVTDWMASQDSGSTPRRGFPEG